LQAHAPADASLIEAQILNSATVGQLRQTGSNSALMRLLGRKREVGQEESFVGDSAEVDTDIGFALRSPNKSVNVSNWNLSFTYHGCNRRLSPHYSSDTTHDEGRTRDTSIVLHQGPLQSFAISIAEAPGQAGYQRVTRRLHPALAAELGDSEFVVDDTTLQNEEHESTSQNLFQRLAESLVNGASSLPPELEQLSLDRQHATLLAYGMALQSGPAGGRIRTSWPDAPTITTNTFGYERLGESETRGWRA
jgi:hypothetical protein